MCPTRPSIETAAVPVITTTGVGLDSGKAMDLQNSLDSHYHPVTIVQRPQHQEIVR